MTHRMMQLLGLLLAVVMLIGTATNCASAADVAEDPVAAVIRQLEEIDTLEQMQAKRASYAVKSRYTVSTTDSSVIAAHENARAQYEAYRDSMFAARLAAQQAYDALSASQQAQISSSLTSKLSQDLPTSFRSETMSLTPGNQAYTFMAVNDSVSGGLCYEVSNHASGTIEIPAIFILVDTADGASSWTPSGRYQPGESNFDVAYCCDVHTILNYGTHYKRINLEDSSYYGPSASRHIRAILENAYPFLSLDEMKSRLKAGGMKSDFVDSLTRSDVIAAVQLAIWAYANAGETTVDAVRYGTSYDVAANRNRYMNPLHEYTNELWDWPGGNQSARWLLPAGGSGFRQGRFQHSQQQHHSKHCQHAGRAAAGNRRQRLGWICPPGLCADAWRASRAGAPEEKVRVRGSRCPLPSPWRGRWRHSRRMRLQGPLAALRSSGFAKGEMARFESKIRSAPPKPAGRAPLRNNP